MDQEQNLKRRKRIFWCVIVFLLALEVLLCDAIYEYKNRKSSEMTQQEQAQKLMKELGKHR